MESAADQGTHTKHDAPVPVDKRAEQVQNHDVWPDLSQYRHRVPYGSDRDAEQGQGPVCDISAGLDYQRGGEGRHTVGPGEGNRGVVDIAEAVPPGVKTKHLGDRGELGRFDRWRLQFLDGVDDLEASHIDSNPEDVGLHHSEWRVA